nr:MAG: RNA-dependent RNA polymerase [Dracophyllum associated narna-like virus 4]
MGSIFDTIEELFFQMEKLPGTSFQECYDLVPNLDKELELEFERVRIKLGSDLDLYDRIEIDKDRELHLIQSVVGDDEQTTTDSASLSPAIIGFGPVINGIRLSWKDTGDSHIVGNYAEGWLLSPPTAEASFEAVNRRHKRNGVPFTLDPVKVKLLSPVRKQSPTWELDLESKMSHLAEIAGWTHRSWFTYDYHQLALLLAPVIFDFEDSVTFPFLFKTEGGCGGAPPYGNLDTVYSAMHHYTRGKSRRAIIGVMEESVGINLGSIKPRESFFLRSSHLANMGDSVWLKYESAYRNLKESGSYTSAEANALLESTEGTALPGDISDFGTEINPDSYVVGSAISALRQDGYLMSELDVKVLLDAKAREEAVFGEKPIGQLMLEQQEQQVAFRSNHLKTLSELSAANGPIRDHLYDRKMMLPDDPGEVFRNIAYTYYRMRTESYATYSSFFYTDTIRLFKTSEISDYLGRSGNRVRADMALTESFPKWRKEFLEENFEERKRRDRLSTWFDSAPLGELLARPLPDGVGTDDSRVARAVVDVVKDHNTDNLDAFIVVLFSGDRQLARTTALLSRPFLKSKLCIFSVDKSSYLAMCLDGLSEWMDLKTAGRLNRDGSSSARLRQKSKDILYYNYLLKRQWPMPEVAVSQILHGSGILSLRKKYSTIVHVEYDYPNMERGLDLLRYIPQTNSVEEYGGGFLESRTLRGFGTNTCWSRFSYEDILSWPDFDYVRSKRHYRKPRYVREDRALVVDPMTPTTYSRVDQWRHNTFPGMMELSNSKTPEEEPLPDPESP